MIVNQLDIIHNLKWDHLIILDACRYDYFAKLWKLRYYNVQKVKSPASWTLEWLSKVFNRKFPNVAVFTATPYINNSKHEICLHGICWKARDKFRKIIEVWKIAWDNELMTVPPWNLYNIVKLSIQLDKRTSTKHRNVIWFLQPHYPYLSQEFVGLLKRISSKYSSSSFVEGSLDILMRHITGIIINNNLELIRKMYEETLKITLDYIYKLIKILDGRVLITSDHGELLGENIFYIVLSTLKNYLGESFNPHYINNKKSPNILKSYIYHISRLLQGRQKFASGYIHRFRLFFHPPIIRTDELNHVPLVIIQ